MEYCGEEQAISCVALVKPKPGVFLEAIQHVLVLATTVEVSLHQPCSWAYRRLQRLYEGSMMRALQAGWCANICGMQWSAAACMAMSDQHLHLCSCSDCAS